MKENRRLRFDRLVLEWKVATMYISSSTVIFGHPAYRALVKMGEPCIEWLLEDIEDNPFLCQALAEITGVTHEGVPAGDVTARAQAWIEWGIGRV
jgi:hypothetical protein